MCCHGFRSSCDVALALPIALQRPLHRVSSHSFRVERQVSGERADLPWIRLVFPGLENIGLIISLAILSEAQTRSICRPGKIIADIFSTPGNKVYIFQVLLEIISGVFFIKSDQKELELNKLAR